MMILNRAAIKADAKAKFQASYWLCVGVVAVTILIEGGCSVLAGTGIGSLATLLVTPVVSAGVSFFFLRIYRGENPEFASMFDSFKNYGHVLGGSLWQLLWTTLWLFVPVMGIIKSIAYSMTPYILMDQPEIGAKDALKVSMAMTEGHKWEIFVLELSFIGWLVLTAFTGGLLGVFYVVPYMNTTMAAYYDKLKSTINVEYGE